jgi:isoquinoline 1-oxidoreductase subunit beta
MRDLRAHPRGGPEGGGTLNLENRSDEPKSEAPRFVFPRRAFLASLGLAAGTLALGFAAPSMCAPLRDVLRGAPKPQLPTGDGGVSPNLFVHIAPDGSVTIVCHRSEMGQGVRSSIPVLIADEMGADMARVSVIQAFGDEAYGDQNTDGSSSIRNDYERLRRMGAAARTMLIAAAAKKWGIGPAMCEARGHAVSQKTDRDKAPVSLAFGELAALAAKLPLPKESEVVLRPRAELTHVGMAALPLLDGPAIVSGQAVFGADMTLPGLLCAVVARPPVVGGSVARYDAALALQVPGVKNVVKLPTPWGPPRFQPLGGIAVLADTTWAAMKGRAALEIQWEPGSNGTYDSTSFREELLAAVRAPGKVVRHVGDVDAALKGATRTVEAEYFVPHLAHATMEPPACVARFDANGCEVWACTQNPQESRAQVAKALGIDARLVTVHVTLLGGGFGRKSKPDYVAEAAILAREAGAPVRLQWTREDDIQHDYFHTVSAQRLSAGLDGDGKVVAWLHRTAFPSIASTFAPMIEHARDGELSQGVLDFPLAIPNVRAENGAAKAHVRIGWLRSVNNIHHAFAMQSFIDEIAHARGQNPRDTLLEVVGPPRLVDGKELGVDKVDNYGAPLTKHPIDTARLRHVIERVTANAGWESRKASGRSLGLAAHRSFLTYVACVASVVLDPNGKIRVDEAWMVADAGTLINADRVAAQMEGAFVFGMSLAFHGAITMKKGAVEQTNFRDYKIARLPEVPRQIHVELVPSDGPPGGVGEPGLPPVAPAIVNAVFALTGKRVRELPLSRALGGKLA